MKKFTSAESFKPNEETNQMAESHIKQREAIDCIDARVQVWASQCVQPPRGGEAKE